MTSSLATTPTVRQTCLGRSKPVLGPLPDEWREMGFNNEGFAVADEKGESHTGVWQFGHEAAIEGPVKGYH